MIKVFLAKPFAMAIKNGDFNEQWIVQETKWI
jgi:hypothetical protein